MIAYDSTLVQPGKRSFCPFAGRRDGKNFDMDHNAIMAKYGHAMRMVDRIPEALSGAMGNQMYLANFKTEEEMNQFYRDVCAEY
jgi:hypothetical protein